MAICCTGTIILVCENVSTFSKLNFFNQNLSKKYNKKETSENTSFESSTKRDEANKSFESSTKRKQARTRVWKFNKTKTRVLKVQQNETRRNKSFESSIKREQEFWKFNKTRQREQEFWKFNKTRTRVLKVQQNIQLSTNDHLVCDQFSVWKFFELRAPVILCVVIFVCDYCSTCISNPLTAIGIDWVEEVRKAYLVDECFHEGENCKRIFLTK